MITSFKFWVIALLVANLSASVWGMIHSTANYSLINMLIGLRTDYTVIEGILDERGITIENAGRQCLGSAE